MYYTNWLKNDTNDEPNNEGDCVVNSGGYWADESCSQTFEVICEEYKAPEVWCCNDYFLHFDEKS